MDMKKTLKEMLIAATIISAAVLLLAFAIHNGWVSPDAKPPRRSNWGR